MIRSSFRARAVIGLTILMVGGPARGQDTAPSSPPPTEASPPADAAPLPTPAESPPPDAAPPTEPASPSNTAPPVQMQPAPPADAPPPPPVAQAPAAVQVQSLDQLDLFSTGREAGFGVDLWKGTSADIARAVIPGLASKPLSPAGVDLARRLLAQASTAPVGAGGDLDLAVARARALLALGDAEDASLVLDRTPGVADHAGLSELAAEAALVSEQNDKACRIADNLTDGRGAPYWLRLRAFCQARAGKADEAQLTFNLAGPPAKGAAVNRLLGVFIAGAGDPGPASFHDGLDFALSAALNLDLAPALPGAEPAISRHWMLKNPPAQPPAPAFADGSAGAAIQTAVDAAMADHPDPAVLEQLIDRASKEPGPKTRARLQAAAALLASLGVEVTGAARAELDSFDFGRPETPAARLLALDLAASAGRKGETVLQALQIAQAGGSGAAAASDLCFVSRSLMRVGLSTEARALVVEGLLALRGSA